jgi:hypothetical protein
MPRLEPQSIETFLRRFHRGREGRLLGVAVRTGRGRVRSTCFELRLRDADAGDADIDLSLELTEVDELRLQVRPTEDPEALADGLAIGTFGGLTFVDLMPWTDRPSGVHDFRLSNCYAAGAVADWEIVAANA